MYMDLDTKVICWDLDDTLGFFRTTYLGIRRGIRETLQNLSDKGFIQYITSASHEEYIEGAVERAGLTQYFEGLFGPRYLQGEGGLGKRYRPIANRHNFSDEQASSSMIVIGNGGILDAPADIGGVVFIHDPNGPYTPSEVLEQSIHRLLEAGNNDFNAGFVALHGKSLDLVDGIKLKLDYKPNYTQPDIVVPTVSVEVDGKLYREHRSLGLETIEPNRQLN